MTTDSENEAPAETAKALAAEWRQKLAAGIEPTREELRTVLALIRLQRTIPAAKEKSSSKAKAPVRSAAELKAALMTSLKGSIK